MYGCVDIRKLPSCPTGHHPLWGRCLKSVSYKLSNKSISLFDIEAKNPLREIHFVDGKAAASSSYGT